MPNFFGKRPKPPQSEEKIHPEELIRATEVEEHTKRERLQDIPVEPKNYKKFQGEMKTGGIPHGISWAIVGLVILFIAGFIISFYTVKQKVKDSISREMDTLQSGVSNLQNFQPQSAAQDFSSLMGASTMDMGGVMGMFSFLFQGGSNAVAAFGDLAKQLSVLSGQAVSFPGTLFDFVAGVPTGDLVSELASVRDTLAAIDADSNTLSGAVSSVGGLSSFGAGDFYLPLKASMQGAKNFLDVFIPWLASDTPHHVLVLLQNPSEIKPAGGFLGSYADVTLASGTITDIAVHDIADVDAAFKKNIVPPKPLQLEITRFRPADANWFFDFPTSASRTIALFEQSNLYASSSFDGAIAISPKVISDLLSMTGPITLSSTSAGAGGGLTFTSSTLMVQIQNIVQKGQATSATYPKAILGQLSEALLQKLASSTDEQKQQMLSLAFDWVDKKDVMAYFKDSGFQNFLASYGATGDVYQMPQNFNGEYLALVDANVRGDKSDLYVTQKVTFDAQINADGTVNDHLVIDRTHNGNKSPYWWYQTTNQDYLQVFVPPASELTNETGAIKKKITAPIDYRKNGYAIDPVIAAIESSTQQLFGYPAVGTHTESGKEVFALWSEVAKGKKTEIILDYTHRLPLMPTDGMPFSFIFEKQAGTNRSYDFTIDAPLGYVFAENGIASYAYTSNDPPGRLIVDLTLQKLSEGQ